MKYTISPDKNTLTLEADESDRAELMELAAICDEDAPGTFGTDQQEVEFLEPLICNSELDWTCAGETGDLTDAPMLCIWGSENSPIAHRWGYPHYAVRSFLTDLMETGKAVFLASW